MKLLSFAFDDPGLVHIQGLSYTADYITRDREAFLLAHIDAMPWTHDLKRRVQHYGYKYDYKARAVNASMFLGGLPMWLQDLAMTLHQDGHFPTVPDQVIVNEYLTGQGISAHIDCVPCFGGGYRVFKFRIGCCHANDLTKR